MCASVKYSEVIHSKFQVQVASSIYAVKVESVILHNVSQGSI